MTTSVFVQGQWVERDAARVSAFDAGLLHGVGLFETMSGGVGADGAATITRLAEHLARLAGSAAELGLTETLHTDPLGEAALEAVRRSGLRRARVRLTVTGGDLNLLETGARSQHTPTLLIGVTPAAEYPPAMFDKGVAVAIADAKANPLDPTAGHKTLNYWWRLRELQRAAARGVAEALVLQVTNHLCGGCVSNLFLVKDGAVKTPIARGEEQEIGGKTALPSPVLPGVTRGAVLSRLAEMGVEAQRRMLSVDDVLDADEVFLTNASWGVLPVVRVEAAAVGGGAVGELTGRVRAALVG